MESEHEAHIGNGVQVYTKLQYCDMCWILIYRYIPVTQRTARDHSIALAFSVSACYASFACRADLVHRMHRDIQTLDIDKELRLEAERVR